MSKIISNQKPPEPDNFDIILIKAGKSIEITGAVGYTFDSGLNALLVALDVGKHSTYPLEGVEAVHITTNFKEAPLVVV